MNSKEVKGVIFETYSVANGKYNEYAAETIYEAIGKNGTSVLYRGADYDIISVVLDFDKVDVVQLIKYMDFDCLEGGGWIYRPLPRKEVMRVNEYYIQREVNSIGSEE